ncbi:hypothetical protein C8J57DRAFT_1223150 [Mycena rebaudengoi]|nr:hypothetical protein C8J57DRAFT_1223150 [Mycena rebaudengoi]
MLAHCPAGVAAMAVLPLPFVGPRITAPVFGYCMVIIKIKLKFEGPILAAGVMGSSTWARRSRGVHQAMPAGFDISFDAILILSQDEEYEGSTMQKAYVRLGRSLSLAADVKMKGFSGEVVDENFLRGVGCEIKVALVSSGGFR